jgi:hypothetical protein
VGGAATFCSQTDPVTHASNPNPKQWLGLISFDSLGPAMLTVFQCITLGTCTSPVPVRGTFVMMRALWCPCVPVHAAGWSDIMYALGDSSGQVY